MTGSRRDTKLAWLGSVPTHWKLTPLGTVFRERASTVSDQDYPALSVSMGGIVPRMDNVALTASGDARKLVRAGDYVINSRSDRKGSGGIAPTDGSVSVISTVLEPQGIDPRYAHHLLRSTAFQEEFYRWGSGIVADLWSTRYSSMRRITLPAPPRDEQRRIADFLDRETAHIDALIEKQQALIERLVERRGAFISHVVDEAEGSRLVPLRRLIRSLDQGWSPNASDWPVDDPKSQWSVLKVGCVNGGVFRPSENKEFAAGDIPESRFTVRTGDVLVSRGNTRELVGSAATVPEDYPCLMLSDLLYRIRVEKDVVLPEYLSMVLGTRQLRDEIELQARGSSQTMPKISQRILLGLKIPMLSLPAQSRVLERISETTDTIDDSVLRAVRFIELTRERRAALITAAVTGQLDITSKEAT